MVVVKVMVMKGLRKDPFDRADITVRVLACEGGDADLGEL